MSSDLLGTLEAQSYVDDGYFVTLKALLFLAEELRPASRSGVNVEAPARTAISAPPAGRVDLRVA
jgi:hypothetical protein